MRLLKCIFTVCIAKSDNTFYDTNKPLNIIVFKYHVYPKILKRDLRNVSISIENLK